MPADYELFDLGDLALQGGATIRGCKLAYKTFGALNADQLVARLEDAQIANANVSTMADVWAHAQLRARERWVQVTTPAGPIPALLPPGMPAGFAPRMDAVPALGEHADAILAELGYAESDIVRLRAAAAI